MTGDNEAFSFLAPLTYSGVVFGSRDKSQIIGKGNVKIPGLPKFENVRYVDGLKLNLISISQLCDDVANEDNSYAYVESSVVLESDNENESSTNQDYRVLFKDKLKWTRGHHDEEIVAPIDKGIITPRKIANEVANVCYVSQIEPKNIKDALTDEEWILAVQEELNQLEKNDVWSLVNRPSNTNVIGTTWVYKNKKHFHVSS
ncbi:uncharacterized protein LOC126609185 [Malus sylvestris]|uniref:uncharacterized protein LOC126609185 n=1 Tax=Malus sylvestris TaxID=3752 RepID=UPI0021ACCE15|nr:uncharacterized protein LOC126609185 [Malus sylvestris]